MNYLRNLKPNKIIEKINKKSVKKWALASSSIPADRFRAQQNSTEWKPSCKSILYLLHKSDLAGRWQEIVKARLRKYKKRSARNLRYHLKLREKKSTMKLVEQLKQAGLKYAQCRPALLQRYSCKKRGDGEPLCHGTDCSCQTLKGKATMAGVQKPTVCGIEVQRELLQPGRKAFTPAIVAQSSIPVVFYYVAYAGLLHALFFCAQRTYQRYQRLVEWQGSALVSLLSVIVTIAGTRLYNRPQHDRGSTDGSMAMRRSSIAYSRRTNLLARPAITI